MGYPNLLWKEKADTNLQLRFVRSLAQPLSK